jgi:hypothetical protein
LLNTILGTLSSGVAAATGSYESIASATGTGSSGTITFSSIPSDYKHLQIRASVLQTSGNPLIIRLNSDTANNYAFHYLYGAGSSGVGAGGTASTNGIYIQSVFGGSSTYYTTLIIDIIDYQSTTKNKTVRVFDGWDANGSGVVEMRSGLWQSTSAITSLTIASDGGGNYSTGSTFALYGVKG